MHSFRQSRSRILFEVFCAFVISASCAGAWIQTGASALLVAAGIAALYGIVHAFDLAGRNPHAAVDQPQSEDSIDCSSAPAAAQSVVLSQPMEPAVAIEEPERVEPPAPRKGQASRAKAPRKGGGRQAKAPDERKVTELAPPVAAEVLPMSLEEAAQPHIEPLFEPEPFVRMPRPAFGRKAG